LNTDLASQVPKEAATASAVTDVAPSGEPFSSPGHVGVLAEGQASTYKK